MKGVASVSKNGQVRRVELHWYEADGIGRKEMFSRYKRLI
jgi:hypothetical protein